MRRIKKNPGDNLVSHIASAILNAEFGFLISNPKIPRVPNFNLIE